MNETTIRPVAPRVLATPEALAFIAELREQHGPLMFFQAGACGDGSSPMCFAAGEFQIGDQDIYLGNVGGTPFYIGADQFAYWQYTQLIIDVAAGIGGMLSLDNGTGRRFLMRSRLFSAEEFLGLSTTLTAADLSVSKS